ncbi:hypothetical protein KAH94_02230 [bacterium]|nr:hypothetical protein [bacterium]
MGIKKLSHFLPGRTILLGLFATITIGTVLLALPMSRTVDIPLLDLFFTSASVTCVTGLFTVPLSDFTMFGQGVLMLLVQIGGISLITMMLFAIAVFAQMGLTAQIMAGRLLEMETWKDIKKILYFIIGITVTAETIGALTLFQVFKHDYPTGKAVFYSIFHSIASFCNAPGISVFPGGVAKYGHSNYLILITTTILVFSGGLGFITWREIMQYCIARYKGKRHQVSLHSKIVIFGTLSLLSIYSIIIFILERGHAFAKMSTPLAVVNTALTAVASRSSGVLGVDLMDFQVATIFVIMMIAFIGSAPGSAGSGIKISTFFVLLATARAAITGKNSVEMFGRRIATDQIFKAVAVVAAGIFWVTLTTFCLVITEKNWQFLDALFESVSAFANLGLTTGITPDLSTTGKLFIILNMMMGRVGALTLIFALKKPKNEKTDISYPKERIMLG